MANFQALFNQGRSSSSSGFQAYNSSHGTQTSTLPSTHYQTPSFTPLREQQQQQQQEELHLNHGFSLNPSFGLPTTGSSGFNYFSGFQDTNSLAFGDPAATGVNGAYAANDETVWPNLTCNTSVRNPSHSTQIFQDPPSPCTPRGHTVLLTDSQEEYLQHMERLNSEALHDSPPPRGRRLSYNPLPLPDERSSRGNNSYIFHPFELDHHAGSQEKHLHVYFDESGMPRHVDVEDSAPTTVTQVDESAAVSGTRGIAPEDFGSQETHSLSFDPPQAAIAGGEKEISRTNADQFDLNEVPVSVGEATPPKPRKKYHPRVAKDKRTYKRRADGKKAPANAGAGFASEFHRSCPYLNSSNSSSDVLELCQSWMLALCLCVGKKEGSISNCSTNW